MTIKKYEYIGYIITEYEHTITVTTPDGLPLNGEIGQLEQAKDMIRFHLIETVGTANAETLVDKAELKIIGGAQ